MSFEHTESPKKVFRAIVGHEINRVRRLAGIPGGATELFDPGPVIDGYSGHRQLCSLMRGLGFDVRCIERLDTHPVWRLEMRRGAVARGLETNAASVGLKEFLKRRGVKCMRSDLLPWVHGDRITQTFIWDGGTPGQVCYSCGRETVFGQELEANYAD